MKTVHSTRREFIGNMSGVLALGALGFPNVVAGNKKPLNIMLITADDLRCEDLGCYGGTVKGLTPHLDKLADEGMRFDHAHVNVGICMPSRISLATGLYGHNSGAMGFMFAREGTPHVVDSFRQSGYAAGLFGKTKHSSARPDVEWDMSVARSELGDGRNPEIYANKCKKFIDQCKTDNKPFYMMVNSHDPHRPFQKPGAPIRGAAKPSALYTPEQVDVPGFLPDLPGVRTELSHYLNSVKRLDDTVGAVLKVLEESGQADNTLVMFISDNGIATPFAKCNCYVASTRTPWIARWPNQIKAGSVNDKDFISGIDFLPTVLELAGLPALTKQDGRSFAPLLRGKQQDQREWVFTQIDSKAGNGYVPMRCVQNKEYGYIFNAWADGKYSYRNNNEGMTMRAMNEAAKTDPAIQHRVNLFRKRCLEELYDLKNDPDCLNNLIDDPKHTAIKEKMHKKLESYMRESTDSLLDAFLNRYDKEKRQAAMRIAKKSGTGDNGKKKK